MANLAREAGLHCEDTYVGAGVLLGPVVQCTTMMEGPPSVPNTRSGTAIAAVNAAIIAI